MKFTLLALLTFFSVAALAGLPVKKIINVEEVFIPDGFDSNDTTEIVISGYLPNLCHKTPSVDMVKKDKNIFLKVTALSYHKTNPFCPQVAVPFIEKVKLGVLNKGEYKIVINENTRYEEVTSINIVDSQDSIIDNHIYANVEYIEDLGDKDNIVALKGYNPSYCFELDRVEYKSNGKNTYSILPIMKQNSELCPRKMTPFSYEILIPKELNRKKVLLHVRSMDGSSINKIVTLQ